MASDGERHPSYVNLSVAEATEECYYDAEERPAAVPSRPRKSSMGQHSLLPEEVSACVGISKAIEILSLVETTGHCAVEKRSVYGAAVAIPQIARSCYWPKTMSVLTLRCYLFLTINYFVQTLFVYYIYDSQTNMNPFGGQMHLCDFAAHIDTCPDGANCHGPGGGKIVDPGSLYPYDIWNTRKFVHDSFVALFPEKQDKIDSVVDPGEYGMESFYCRLLCIFVFMVSIADEFQTILDFFRLLYYLPSAPGLWVRYEIPSWADKQHVKDVHGIGELDFVHFQVNGMPLKWKIVNFFSLMLPKIFIWRGLSMAGVQFIMETAGMVDQVINTTALSFVFTLDELILDRLTTKATRHIMENLEDYALYDSSAHEDETEQEALNRYYSNEMNWRFGAEHYWLLPRRLFWSLSLMTVFLGEYYYHNCHMSPDGSWVSNDMYLPDQSHLSPACFVWKVFGQSCPRGGESVFWSMTL
eukprot:TRINITY_DN33342_c0_g1_i1.p1 TRINITY_DN33342_c0_g1~~TRINITY_DN33342_c0_g1_i1.p1  ORF type:complete len:470 (-),score=74.22 TRINITY_DN33342_c0_g1_i1:91-1500(-)